MLGITDDTEKRTSNRKRKRGVSFNEDDEIINPEDIDPSVGRFRNLIQTTVIPGALKRQKLSDSIGIPTEFKVPRTIHSTIPELYQDLPPESNTNSTGSSVNIYSSLSSRLGMVLPNPAPDVDMGQGYVPPLPFTQQPTQLTDAMEPKKRSMQRKLGLERNLLLHCLSDH